MNRLSVWGKIERKGKRNGGREPVDKHWRPLFRPLVIILPNSVSKIVICQSISRLSKPPGKINGNAPSENKVKWVASVIVDFEKSR